MAFAFYHEWRHHLRCIITVPHGKNIRILKVRWLIQGKDTFDDIIGKDKHTYNIKLEDAMISNKNNPILYYKKGNSDPIKFTDDKYGKSSKLYHVALKSKVAEDVLNEDKNKSMFIIIGLFVIVIIGIGLYSQYLLNEQSNKILLLTKQLAGILANQTKAVIIR